MKVVVQKLEGGDRGVLQTLEKMRELALRDSYLFKRFRKVGCCCGLERIRKVWEYVRGLVSYRRDPVGKELVVAPVWFVKGKVKWGDCDDMSTLLASSLVGAGCKVRFVVIAWRRWEYTHVYVEVFVNDIGGWLPLDLTLEEWGQEKKEIIRRLEYGVN